MTSPKPSASLLPPILHPAPIPTHSHAHSPPRSVFSFSRSNSLPLLPVPEMSAFLAGALAGAASRTVVSPLERLKILLQVQGSAGAYEEGIIKSLAKMWREEGFRGYMRGNGINVLRIAPYSAVQFSTYELIKGTLVSTGRQIDTPERLFAGSLAGIASVVSTYPLDLVRSRLSIESASLGDKSVIPEAGRKSSSIIGMTIKVYKTEGGIRGLYRGLTPTAAGVAPYVALNFATYELFKNHFTTSESQPGTFTKLGCGALAGSISQSLTYPLDVLRRRMQVTGLASMQYHYDGAFDAVRQIVKADGIKGLFKGIRPNLVKVGPSIGVSFATYEAAKDAIDQWQDNKAEEKMT